MAGTVEKTITGGLLRGGIASPFRVSSWMARAASRRSSPITVSCSIACFDRPCVSVCLAGRRGEVGPGDQAIPERDEPCVPVHLGPHRDPDDAERRRDLGITGLHCDRGVGAEEGPVPRVDLGLVHGHVVAAARCLARPVLVDHSLGDRAGRGCPGAGPHGASNRSIPTGPWGGCPAPGGARGHERRQNDDRNGMAQLFHHSLTALSCLVIDTPDGVAIASVAGVRTTSGPAIRARRLRGSVERPKAVFPQRVTGNVSPPTTPGTLATNLDPIYGTLVLVPTPSRAAACRASSASCSPLVVSITGMVKVPKTGHNRSAGLAVRARFPDLRVSEGRLPSLADPARAGCMATRQRTWPLQPGDCAASWPLAHR